VRSIRSLAAARRFLATAVAGLALATGLAAGAPAAHAGGCTWTAITLVNGWHSEQSVFGTGNPSYCLEGDGMVYLSGSVAQTGNLGDVFGTLPASVRPTHELYFAVYTLNTSQGVLRIDTDGTLNAYNGQSSATTSQGYTSLAGISYPSAGIPQHALSLTNGWQSDQGVFNTGDPSYSVTNSVAHLSGSLARPAGTPPVFSSLWIATTLPSAAAPANNCFASLTYTFGGGTGIVETDPANKLSAGNAQYTSLAGISYPVGTATWLTLANGTAETSSGCIDPSFTLSGNVVYLVGTANLPANSRGVIGTLPPSARPAHALYMITSDGPQDIPHVTVRVDPSGAVAMIIPPEASGSVFVSLSGLSFHLGS
jgi:hypothetical protein